ncbi:CheR family methyltransferase [Massilia endophytica]|uniref:CheR family methyltransferase n=1 Tax=Massilia endophytica TaxID=2899220 RepID=UPI001E4E1384|nr:CheR family methyltransferase [Massilia endophytica]UGQ49007.1 chemotaxis protein [Massilia endophytica]
MKSESDQMAQMADLRRDSSPEVEALELELLLEAVVQRFGFDFRSHERLIIKRKLFALMQRRGLRTLSQLQDRVLHDLNTCSALLRALSVPPAAMFDDPQEASQLRDVAAHCLPGAALPRVWLADCAGAEQAWTTAVILAEQQLLWRTEIYATVSSDDLLEEAAQAVIPAEKLPQCQRNYEMAGGTGNLADYFQIEGKDAVLLPKLRNRITWAQYNLVTDASFNEFQLIVCRRALPDFGPLLRQRVLHLFHESLAVLGVLGVDRLLDSAELPTGYQPALPQHPWYKRVA